MDQTAYCTKVDGSLLQGEIFPSCGLTPNKVLWRVPALMHQSWSVCQVFTAVTCKLTDIALHMHKCPITGGKRAPQVRIRRLSVSSGILVAVEHICLNFLQCPSFQVPPFPWAGSKAASKADCGYNLWCEHECTLLSLNRS